MNKINSNNVVKLIYEELFNSNVELTPITIHEIELKDKIIDIIKSCGQSIDCTYETEQTLEFDEYEAENEINYNELLDEDEESDTFVEYADKVKAVDFWKAGMKKLRTLECVQNRYRFVKNRRQLYRWQDQINDGGSRLDKIKMISDFLIKEFQTAKSKNLIVHDIDLKRWSLNKNKETQLYGFSGSGTFIKNFKRINRIVSRKITKFVTRKHNQEVLDINATAELFVNSSATLFQNYELNHILNSDQSGFNLEIHSGRTLEYKGTTSVYGTAQSLAAMTHSYTIQPTITASGQLLSPLFIVLQQPEGEFGPRIRETIFSASNIYVKASKSGKLTNDLLCD